MTGGTELHAAEAVDDGGSLPTFASTDAVKLWLSQRFARETDQEQLLRVTGAAVGTFLGAMRVSYGEVDSIGTGLIVPLDWTRDGVPTLAGNHWFDPASEFAGLARSGRTIVVEETDAPPIAGTTTRAFIIVPLIHDGRPVAIFSVADDRPRRWTTEEVTLVSQTGARLWSALQHLRLTEQLRESEEQFRMMAENLPGICWVGDSEAKPLWGNTRWHAMYDETTAAHGDGRGVIHPDDLDRARAIWRDMRVNGVPGEFQLRLRGRDGIYRPFASKATPIRDAVGTVVRWVGVQIDLSDQAAQDRRQAVLRSFADRAREMSDPIAIMTLLAGMLAEHVGVEQFIFVEASHGKLDEGTMYRAIDGAHVTAFEPTLSAAFGAFAVRPDPESTFVATDVKSMADDSPIRISALAMGAVGDQCPADPARAAGRGLLLPQSPAARLAARRCRVVRGTGRALLGGGVSRAGRSRAEESRAGPGVPDRLDRPAAHDGRHGRDHGDHAGGAGHVHGRVPRHLFGRRRDRPGLCGERGVAQRRRQHRAHPFLARLGAGSTARRMVGRRAAAVRQCRGRPARRGDDPADL